MSPIWGTNWALCRIQAALTRDSSRNGLEGMSSSLDESITPTASANPADARSLAITFSALELASFASEFERVRDRLPRMFRPFWHRWTYCAETPAFLIHAETGDIALCLFRGDAAGGHFAGFENCRLMHPWPPHAPLHQVLQAAGLLQPHAFKPEILF